MTRTLVAVATAALAVATTPVVAQDWQGPHIGIAGGFGFVDDDEGERTPFDTNQDGVFNDTVRTTTGADAFATGPVPGGFCGGSPNSNNLAAGCKADDDAEGEFALRAGYDWQSGPWVYGVVGEYAATEASDSVTAFSITPAQYSFKRTLDSYFAARVRVGHTYGRFLPYVTGGLAYGRFENRYATSNTANSFAPLTSTNENLGFQLGAGVETKVADRLRVGVEYLYTSIEDDSDYTVRIGAGSAPLTNPFRIVNPTGTDQRRGASDFDLHSVRFTVGVSF